jgi:WD40 repeat protein
VRPPTDAFLSYSRKNRDFVRRLHDFLVEQGKDIWLDEEDIPPASEWEKDIAESIDAAYGFVFVVSKHSLASKECAKELDYAIGHGKRIVPIACDDAHPSEARDELRKVNWVLCRNGDDQATAFAAVLQGLDTDLEWTHESTRLLMRAVEWDESGQNSSFLLRGSDLREAEEQLAAGASKDPPPTELHSTYILASRHAATRRQRMLLGGVSVALAVAIGLGVLALLQRNDARRATRAATSVALASAANDRIGAHPDQALLLALAAYESSPSGQARGAALNALEQARTLGVGEFLHGDSVVDSVAFSTDGRTVAVGSADGTVQLWDVRNHRKLAALEAPGRGPVASVAFGPRGLVMAASSNGVLRFWNADSSRAMGELKAQGAIVAAAISSDGRLVAAADGHGHVWLWKQRTGAPEQLPAPPGPDVTLAFSHDGRTLAAGVTNTTYSPKDDPNAPPQTPGAVAVYDTRRSKLLGRLPNHEDAVYGLAFSPRGNILATAGTNTKFIFGDTPGKSVSGEIRLWRARLLQPTGQTVASSVPIMSVGFLPDGRTVFACREDGSLQLASPSTGAWIAGRRQPLSGSSFVEGSPIPLALSSDGRTFAAAVPNSTTVRLGPVRHRLALGRTTGGGHETFSQLAFEADGRRVAVLGQDGTTGKLGVQLADVDTGAFRTPPWLRAARNADDVALSPDGRWLAVSNLFSGAVQLWDLQTHERAERLPPPRGGALVMKLLFNRSGSELAVGYPKAVRLWDVRQHRWSAGTNDPAGVTGLAFAGSTLLIVGAHWTVDRWNGRSAVHRVFTPPASAAEDGAVGSNDWLWKLVAALAGSGGGAVVDGATLSPDGKTLAIVQNLVGAGIELWDVGTRTPLGPQLTGLPNAMSVAFSPDGTTLAAVNDNALRIWPRILWRNVADLRTRVCGLVLGDFGASEWSAIAPGLPLPHPCG